MPAHDIDDELVPRPVGGTLTVVVGDESVILNGWRTATVLNATAALIWERLNGRASVGQIAARLAATEGVPADLVLAEVLDVVRNVGAIGLLEDVPPPDGLVVTAEPIPRPVAGDTLDNLGLSTERPNAVSFAGSTRTWICLVTLPPRSTRPTPFTRSKPFCTTCSARKPSC